LGEHPLNIAPQKRAIKQNFIFVNIS